MKFKKAGDVDKAVYMYEFTSKTVPEILQECKIGNNTLYDKINELGIEKRGSSGKFKATPEEMLLVINDYRKGLLIRQIVEKRNISSERIYRILHHLEETLRRDKERANSK